MFVCQFLLLGLLGISISAHEADDEENRLGGSYVYENTRPSQRGKIPQWDSNGYVFFCLCMGRSGNQMEHLLGGMAFAKSLNRTLVLPPFRTYRNVRFTEWFQFDPLEAYHRVVLSEDFMEYLAPEHWPPGQRKGFCWLPPGTTQTDCKMKEGSPFGPFWDGVGVNFDASVIYHLSYHEHDLKMWHKSYPASQFPVLALRGAPASFPVQRRHRALQQHLHFSDRINAEAQRYADEHFKGEEYVGVHLRNGPDWANACRDVDGRASYMASDQCLEDTPTKVSTALCLPSKSEVLRLIKKVVAKTKVKVVFVATDKDAMIDDITKHLGGSNKVRVFHADPWLPIIDWAILIKSKHFIGNCVSSFSSFVKRARDVEGKPTSYWGFS